MKINEKLSRTTILQNKLRPYLDDATKKANGCLSHQYPNKTLRLWGRRHSIRRWIYELSYGPLPEGSYLKVGCGNTATCVNPEHQITKAERESFSKAF